MRNTVDKTLTELGRHDPRICFVVGDVSPATFKEFTAAYPDRFWNVGIAEAMMVGGAAGLAMAGKVPFLCTIATFMTMRCYEQIRDDIGYQKLNVKLIGIGAGLSYSTLGGTHHAIEDIAIMRVIPGMTVIAPADPAETARVMQVAVSHVGPMYIRIARNNEPALLPTDATFAIGQAVPVGSGTDCTIVTTGVVLGEVLKAVAQLKEDGISAQVLHMPCVKPIDVQAIRRAAGQTPVMVSVEEHSVIGGLGSAVAEVLAETGTAVRFRRLGVQDRFISEYGGHVDMLAAAGIDATGIRAAVKELCQRA